MKKIKVTNNKISKVRPTLSDWSILIEKACKAKTASEILKLQQQAESWDLLPVDLLETADDYKLIEKWRLLFEKRLLQLDSLSKEADELCNFKNIVFSS